jgi:hypothetical protein
LRKKDDVDRLSRAQQVTSWIARGLINVNRCGTGRASAQGGDQYWIRVRDVRAFIIDNAAAVGIRKVDKFWLINSWRTAPSD